MKKLLVTFTALLSMALAPTASAITIIDGTTQGFYNSGLGDLAAMDGAGGFLLAANSAEGDPNLTFATDPLASSTYTAAFGTDWLGGDLSGGSWSATAVAIPNTWSVNTESAIIYNFTLSDVSDLDIDLGVDNGILVWLDGNYLFGAQRGGGSVLGEHMVNANSIAAGSHSLQILREDHGGGTGYAIKVDAKAVPEPSTIALLGLSLIGLAGLRRR